MKVLRWLDENIEDFFMVIFLVLISVVMLAQIFARYVFNNSMSWPEEFCRYCYIWTVFFSISYTIKKGNMLRVGIIMDMFPQTFRNCVKILCDVIMLLLFAWFFQHSLQVVSNIKNVTGEISSAMQMPMWVMYMSTVIGFGLAAIRTLQSIVYAVSHFSDRSDSTMEATLKEAKEEVKLLEGSDN